MNKRLSQAFDTLLSEEDLLCRWFDPRKGYGLFVGKTTLKEMLIHRKCIALSRKERYQLKKGVTVKKADWQVL